MEPTDASQLEFVRRYIGTALDRAIITEEQKREALCCGSRAKDLGRSIDRMRLEASAPTARPIKWVL
jgi:hypothetical protein